MEKVLTSAHLMGKKIIFAINLIVIKLALNTWSMKSVALMVHEILSIEGTRGPTRPPPAQVGLNIHLNDLGNLYKSLSLGIISRDYYSETLGF